MEHQSQKSFWKRRGLKLPGSYSTTDKGDKPSKTDVIGARYTYNSSVTFHDASMKPVMLPSQYPAGNSSTATQQQQKQLTGSKSTDKRSQKKHHARSTSTQKSFNTFLKDTNDEWSDDIHEPGKQPREATLVDTSTHQAAALEKASKAVEAALSTTPMPANPPPQSTRKSKSTNPNGIKDHVQDILLDPTLSLKWIDLEQVRDPLRSKKFKQVLAVSNVDLGKEKGWWMRECL
ncbi:hypothetical protein MBANPS3_005552 [Mucor bainieri]